MAENTASLMKIFYSFSFSVVALLFFPAGLSSKTLIKFLPGFDGPLPFELYTGYITIDLEKQTNFFYYFIKSERNPIEDPLLLWLTGGPGCSALTGVVYEIGPLNFDTGQYNGGLPTLVSNPNSWTKFSSIIFLDAPIGTGFSYSKDPEGYNTSDLGTSKEVYRFMIKWLIEYYPEFISNPLYIAGDSYAGITIPVITQEILNGIATGVEPRLNLKGYLLGNPITDDYFDSKVVPHAHGLGLISQELYEAARRSCRGKYASPSNSECSKNLEAVNQCISGINLAYILEPLCPFFAIGRRSLRSQRSPEEKLGLTISPLECRAYLYMLSYYWANNESVREALHIEKATTGEWVRCNQDLNYSQDVRSAVKYHLSLSTSGLRALVYSGDHDLIVPFLGTQSWIKSLGFSIVDDWRSWSVDDKVAGFTRTYSNNMTFATVMAAGHTAPEHKPKECFAMFQRWISNLPL